MLSFVGIYLLVLGCCFATAWEIRSSQFAAVWNDDAPHFTAYPINSYNRTLSSRWVRVEISRVKEVRPRNGNDPTNVDVLVEYEMPSTGFEVTQDTVIVNNISAQRIQFRKEFPNGGEIIATFWMYEGNTTLPLPQNLTIHPGAGWWTSPEVNITDYLPPPGFSMPVKKDSVKFSFEVNNWPFDSPLNYLEFETMVNSSAAFDSSGSFSAPPLYHSEAWTDHFVVQTTFVTFAVSDDQHAMPCYFDFFPIIQPGFLVTGARYWNYFLAFNRTLVYDPDISLLLVNEPRCNNLNNCNDQGTCIENNVCECDTNWGGQDCSQPSCPRDCSGHGVCLSTGGRTPQCDCQDGWLGNDCSVPDCPGSPDCHGHGTCDGSSGIPTCSCNPGWTGTNCSLSRCPGLLGCVHGRCSPLVDPPACLCDPLWGGEDCTQSFACASDSDCNEGTCSNSVCTCPPNWMGHDCSIALCPGFDEMQQTGNCNFRGTCNPLTHTCQCRSGWHGEDCSVGMCEDDCNDRGVCHLETDTPTCLCEQGWTGTSCAIDENELNGDNDHDPRLSQGAIAGIAVAVGVVVVAGVAATITITTLRRRRHSSFLYRSDK